MTDLEREAAFLVALAQAGIAPDLLELLVHGDPSRGIAPHALRKAIAALQPNAAMVAALRQWKCGSCGGSGEYLNKFYNREDDELVEERLECKVCEGHGLNPIARSALSASPQAGAEDLTTRVRRLVVASRAVVLDGDVDGTDLHELDQASEAFASEIAWDDEPTPAPVKESLTVGERWRCEICHCCEFARVQDAHGQDTSQVRCVSCKRVVTYISTPAPARIEREAVARIIDPEKWRVLDGYLTEVKRKYRGQNVAYDPDQFKDNISLAKADQILALLSTSGDEG